MKTKQERSELFKLFQENIKKSGTFEAGKRHLLDLRADLAAVYDHIFSVCGGEDLCAMPLSGEKTIAYYIYHLIRIEDIVSNTLIAGETQLFFAKGFDKLLNAPVITTGNEIAREGLIAFSKALDIAQLKSYAASVWANTNTIVQNMSFEESKTKVPQERKDVLLKLNAVSTADNAFWLVDYWCRKTHAGLLLMPFSRHQMMHLDGCLRIIDKLKK